MLDKAIYYGKEKRKQYRKPKSMVRSCRNHGGCPWCEDDRNYHNRKEKERINLILKEDLLDLL